MKTNYRRRKEHTLQHSKIHVYARNAPCTHSSVTRAHTTSTHRCKKKPLECILNTYLSLMNNLLSLVQENVRLLLGAVDCVCGALLKLLHSLKEKQ